MSYTTNTGYYMNEQRINFLLENYKKLPIAFKLEVETKWSRNSAGLVQDPKPLYTIGIKDDDLFKIMCLRYLRYNQKVKSVYDVSEFWNKYLASLKGQNFTSFADSAIANPVHEATMLISSQTTTRGDEFERVLHGYFGPPSINDNEAHDVRILEDFEAYIFLHSSGPTVRFNVRAIENGLYKDL